MAAALRGEDDRRVFLLRGGVGSGRGATVRRAAEQAGVPAIVLRVDFEGWDDDPAGLPAYIAQLADKRRAHDAATVERMVRRAEALASATGASAVKGLLLGALLDLEDPAAPFDELLAATGDDALPITVEAMVGRWIDGLSRDRAVLLHVTDLEVLPLGAVRALLAERVGGPPEAAVRPLVVALGAGARAVPAAAVPLADGDPAVIDFRAPAADEVGDALAERIESRIAALPRLHDNVRDLLRAGALCGELIPAELVLGALGLVEERQEDVLDLVDTELVETEPPVLVETEVQHRAFPSVSIYRFADPRAQRALLRAMGAELREEHAQSMLRALELQLPKTCRAEARLLASVAEHLDDARTAARYGAALAAWVAVDEAGVVVDDLVRWMAAAEADAEVLWVLANRSRGRWPPQRVLAVLDAFGRLVADTGSLPDDVVAPLAFLRAESLLAARSLADAAREAERAAALAAERFGAESAPHAAALRLHGHALVAAGASARGRILLEQALTITDRTLGADHAVSEALRRELDGIG